MKEELPEDATDVCKWIDTGSMLVDCLTKHMDVTAMTDALNANMMDIAQTAEAKLKKLQRQAYRQAAKLKKDLGAQDSEGSSEQEPE